MKEKEHASAQSAPRHDPPAAPKPSEPKADPKIAYIPKVVPPEPVPDKVPEAPAAPVEELVPSAKVRKEFAATRTKIGSCVDELGTLQCTYNSPKIAQAVMALGQAQSYLDAEIATWQKPN